MRKVALFCLMVACILCGCRGNDTGTKIGRQGMQGSNAAGPIFDYGQTKASDANHIKFGDVPIETHKITATILISNSGREALVIEKVFGQCSCFAGWEGDKKIEAGRKGAIKIFFDKNKMESGPTTHFVFVKTNDPANSEVKLLFDFNVKRSPEEDMQALQNEIKGIKNELQSLRKDIQDGGLAKNGGNSKTGTPVKQDMTIYEVAVGASPVLGADNAAVTITEFIDFQCPYCTAEYPKIKQILAEFPGKVRLVFKHYPLGFHKQAPVVHAATEMALKLKGVDAFWKMHDMIMQSPKKLEQETIKGYAQSIGLDTAELEKLLANEEAISDFLKADKELATKCKVYGTPTIFVNGRKLADRSIEGYRKEINRILSSENKVVSLSK